MTTITVTGVELTKKGLSKLRRDLGRTSVLSSRMGRALVEDARRRIATQGGGSWAPLSKWTRARTGRDLALITEMENISFKLIGGQLVIGHDSDGSWSLDDHEKGFTTAPDVPSTISLKRPELLGVTGNSIHIRRAKNSITPARRVFPNQAEAHDVVEPIVRKWVADIIRRSGRV